MATASGSSPFTWKTGTFSILVMSVAVAGRAAFVGVRREADLVVDDDVNRAAGGVPLKPAQVERLRGDSLAR